MGAAESIFFEEEEEEGLPVEQQYPTVSQQTSDGAPPRQALPGNGSPRVARRQKRGNRAVPPPKMMHGLILGLPSSGKRTLLERLKGKDPFANPPNISGDETSDDKAYQAIVPYQAPSGASMWDRLQIKVEVSPHEVPFNNKIDFAVVMVNPKHSRMQVQAKLNQVISDLLKHYGYTQQQQRTEKDTTQQSGNSTISTRKALCLCFLVNFRDLQTSKKRGLQQTDIKQCVLGLLQQHADQLPPRDQMLLQFGTTSLYNCYGLSTLHHFMYQAYLRLKQNELEQQLAEVRLETAKSGESPHVKYKDFLKMLEETGGRDSNGKAGPSKKSQHGEQLPPHQPPPSPHIDENDGVPNRTVNKQPEQQHAMSRNDSPEGRRQILVRGKQQSSAPPMQRPEELKPQTQKNSRDALEAFLASDDEEDEIRLDPNSKAKFTTESDDDDDDFFYDESGHRRGVNQAMNSPPAEEEEVEEEKEKKEAVKNRLPPQSNEAKEKGDRTDLSHSQSDESGTISSLTEEPKLEAHQSMHSNNDEETRMATDPTKAFNADDASGTVEAVPRSSTAEKADTHDVAGSDEISEAEHSASKESAGLSMQRPESPDTGDNGGLDNDDLNESIERHSEEERKRDSPEETPAADEKGTVQSDSSGINSSDAQSQNRQHHSSELAGGEDQNGTDQKNDITRVPQANDKTAGSYNETRKDDGSLSAGDQESEAPICSLPGEPDEKSGEGLDGPNASYDQNHSENMSGTRNVVNEVSNLTASMNANGRDSRSMNDGDSDDDEFFVGEDQGMMSKDSQGKAGVDSDEDEFFIGGSGDSAPAKTVASNGDSGTTATHRHASLKASSSKTQSDDVDAKDNDATSSPSSPNQGTPGQQQEVHRPRYRKNRHMYTEAQSIRPAPKAETSPGLSAAAQAAIEAAQVEAEHMMHQVPASLEEPEPGSSLDERAMKKAKKKKEKKKEGKKEKKQKKEKKPKRKGESTG